MAGRIIKGLLDALDEGLGGRVLGETAGMSLARSGFKARRLDIPTQAYPQGVLTEPSRLNLKNAHPDVYTGTDPLHRMLHGTPRSVVFDRPAGDLNDVGLHLTPSPGIADAYAVGPRGSMDVGKGSGGPRVYPMLVDPGKTYKGITIDAGPWNDPKQVARRIQSGFERTNPDQHMDDTLDELVWQLNQGKPINKAIKNLGYDSLEFGHGSPYMRYGPDKEFDDISAKALMLFDPRRAIPEFTPLGQRLKQQRGVLSIGPDRPYPDEYYTSTALSSGRADDYNSLIDHALGGWK